jgi:3-hydroxypropanoate dehydrogenase
MAEQQQAVRQRRKISHESLNQLFHEARTQNGFLPDPVPIELLKEVYALTAMGPTSANSSPARFIFVTTPEGKERLLRAVAPGNVDKVKSAPVTVIVAWDTEFYDRLGQLFPTRDMRPFFAGNAALAHETAFRNGSLQGAYLILAARALGLDVGPMSGFDQQKLNAEFFPDGKWKANFLCNLGYGDTSKLFPRNPRLSFEEACLVL